MSLADDVAREATPPHADGLKIEFSVNLEPLFDLAEKQGGLKMDVFNKLLAAFAGAWHFIVSHHEDEAHVIQMAEVIATPFIKSDKARAALQLSEEIAKRATDALAAAHDAEAAQ